MFSLLSRAPKVPRSLKLVIMLVACSAVLSACYHEMMPSLKMETAKRLAGPTFMHHRSIEAGAFNLLAFERIREPGGEAHIYLGADGETWSGTETQGHDPTPANPVALHLATRDNGKNVIFLTRPCHYKGMSNGDQCPLEYWTSERFGETVMNAMNIALDDIAKRYKITKFHLIGYDGGASMAALLASERRDIATIRTVAGRLDYSMTNLRKDDTMPVYTPDASSVATEIRHIPQHHFIGAWDTEVGAYVFDNYLGHAVFAECIRASIIDEVSHDKGWVSRWPVLLKAPLDCNSDL